MLSLNKLLERRKGGNVKRFHTMTMHREHLVSSHSWGVAQCVLAMWPDCRAEVLRAALNHDVAEYVTGDVSAPTKWQYPELANLLETVEEEVSERLHLNEDLTDLERVVLKVADMGDLVLSCHEEYVLGNKYACPVMRRGIDFIAKRVCEHRNPMIESFYHDLRDFIWENVNERELHSNP